MRAGLPQTAAVTSDARRWKRWRRGLAIFLGILLVLGVTVTPPSHVRFVDARSGAPISGLRVVAIWHLFAGTPAGQNASTVLKIKRLTSNEEGAVHLGFAAMVHAPVFPLGFRFRDAAALPVLYVVDARYEPSRLGNGFDPTQSEPLSVLSVQRSSINTATVRMAQMSDELESQRRRELEDLRDVQQREVAQAMRRCQEDILCQEDDDERRQ